MSSAVSNRQRSNGSDLSRDETFEILSNRRRRFALHYLQQNGAKAELGDLAERIAAWENDIPVEEVSAADRKLVYTSLQQFHLPKMDDQGVVTFDQRDGTVELTDRAEGMDLYLEVIEGYEMPWSLYYVGLTMLGTLLVAASWFGIPPFATVGNGEWIVFLLMMFGVSSVAHASISRRNRIGSEGPPPEVRDSYE